jgi:hypothetical protein
MNPKKSMITHIFDNIVSSSLNDCTLEDIMRDLSKEQLSLIDLVDQNNPVAIGNIF